MHENSHIITQLLVIFGAAVVFVPLAQKSKLGSIIGYLIGGMLIGPYAFNFVNDLGTINYIAEFGIVFLLFLIGIEMKPQRLWTMRRMVLGLGGAQIILTGALFFGGALYLGLTPPTALIVGLGLALSSTAMGLQLLSDRGELQSTTGRTSFSILLMQDLSVPILFALVSVMAGPSQAVSGSLFMGIVEGVALLALTFIVSRFALKPIMSLVASAGVKEVFTAFALLLILGMAYLMETIGLSLAMGAFLAGIFLADSEFRHQIEADILPFRGLLLGLFFMGVGMGIDFSRLLSDWQIVLGLVLGLMLTKVVVIYCLARLFSFSPRESLRTGTYLSQAGEFGFVLFAFAASNGLMNSTLLGSLMLVVAISMALTPFILPPLLTFSNRFSDNKEEEKKSHQVNEGHDHDSGRFIIAGFGRVGQIIAHQLDKAGYPYIAFDTDLEKVKAGREKECNVYFGDASSINVLSAAHADRASGMILTMDDPQAIRRAVHQVRDHYPGLGLHSRAHDLKEAINLKKNGVLASVPETIEAALQLGLCAMSHHPECGKDDINTIKDRMGAIREDDYREFAEFYDLEIKAD
ncbi:cation:proton antiporter [Temperatibacter marinus]|uniref:Cation:proton antiporter n=1 Tax=Temperatibacter marinus TaxID=1456591 RepID=A0AA52HAZ4_9PROT|nr:cation:proton antiporter [Temperatibacter marinus]WND03245.1 cation:proton antiporter [Temperatibacter marinus]